MVDVQDEPEQPNDPPKNRGGWSVRSHFVAILAVVLVVFVSIGTIFAVQTWRDAESRARKDLDFQAALAARSVTDALTVAQQTAAGLVAPLSGATVAQLSGCSLVFAGDGPFPKGHVDVITADGTVACSSYPAAKVPAGASDAGVGWLFAALSRPTAPATAPFTDPLTGEPAIAVTVPARTADGASVVIAVVVTLPEMSRGLTQAYGGPLGIAYSVTGPTGVAFAGADVPGRAHWTYGTSNVAALNWRLVAGVPTSKVLAPTRAALVRAGQLAAIAFLLAVFLSLLVNRRIVSPLRRLTAAVGQASRRVTPVSVDLRGPSELRQLTGELNDMIAARTTQESQLEHVALHDRLTDLPNRALFLDRLRLALQASRESGSVVAVLFLDLDRFQLVNNTYGHDVGDEVLRTVAERLRVTASTRDVVGRFGGDEFAVVCPGLSSPDEAALVASRITSCFAEPFVEGDRSIRMTASIGISVSGHGSEAAAMLRDADTALNQAKERGRARFEFFDEPLRQRASNRLALQHDLSAALELRQMHVVYQPLVNMRTGVVLGAEALLRWEHPTRGSVSPSEFIPLAEETGQILQLGQFVLREACLQASTWAEARLPLRVSVNVSGRQLFDGELPGQIAAITRSAGISPKALCLELTESVLMEDPARASTMLRRLKDQGVSLSIDDFGTGYSSLAYLLRFPVDELKIDRVFVRDMAGSVTSRNLVAAIVAMARSLDLQVVAEGVEDREQVSELLEMDCDLAQGYLFARPQEPGALTALLTDRFEDQVLARVRRRDGTG